MNDILVREARDGDIDEIREIFMEAYGPDYPYQDFYDEEWLKRAVYGDQLVMVVAEESASGAILGTGSVAFDIGVDSDLVGEFGRLAVHKEARGQGIARKIMKRRIELIEKRLHVAIVDNRTTHPYSQRISEDFGFVPVGFMPIKHRFNSGTRESIATYARHFGSALTLRRNHPRVIPEVAPVAHLAMENLGMHSDLIVDESTPSYIGDDDFELSELEAQGMPYLLRIERGRVRDRHVFGPMQLTSGFFKLATKQANYLVARRPGMPSQAVAGAIGFLYEEQEKNFRVFELIAASDQAIRFLFVALLERAQELGVEYIEVEVSAHGTALQRTLMELDFLPAAFIPAMVFHEVERLDVVKMVHLLADAPREGLAMVDAMKPIFELIMKEVELRDVVPRIAENIDELAIFKGLNEEQARRLASAMSVITFEGGQPLFEEKEPADEFYILLDGSVNISFSGADLGELRDGEVVGENAMLAEANHSATVRALEPTTAAVLTRGELGELIRRRPDIATILYRNLAMSLGEKLRRADAYAFSSIENGSVPK